MQRPWEQGGFVSYPEAMHGEKQRVRSATFADHFSQASLFWLSQAAWERDHIVSAFCFELGKVEIHAIQERMVSNLTQVDAELASRVADGLGVAVPPPPKGAANVPRSNKPESDAALSLVTKSKGTIIGRKVAFLVANGVDGASINAMKKALEADGASVKLIAPKLGQLKGSDGMPVNVDHSLPTVSSAV